MIFICTTVFLCADNAYKYDYGNCRQGHFYG